MKTINEMGSPLPYVLVSFAITLAATDDIGLGNRECIKSQFRVCADLKKIKV